MARKRAIFSRTYPRRSLRRGILAEICRLAAQMAEDKPTLGLHRIQRALRHRVGRSTIARILKLHRIAPVPERPTLGQASLRAHSWRDRRR